MRKMKKGIAISLIAIIAVLTIAGCSSGTTDSASNAPAEKVYVDESEFERVYTEGDSYAGKYMAFTGMIFNVEETEDAYFIQAYQDFDNANHNTTIEYGNKDIKFEQGDFIKVDGVIEGTMTYENIYGDEMVALCVEADTIEVTSYLDAALPTIKTIEVGETIEKDGYSLTLDKVEIADAETRCYYTLVNNGSNNFSLSTYTSVITQDSSQANYMISGAYFFDPEPIDALTFELRPGVETSGYIAYDSISTDGDFTIYLDGVDMNKFKSYEFTYNVENN